MRSLDLKWTKTFLVKQTNKQLSNYEFTQRRVFSSVNEDRIKPDFCFIGTALHDCCIGIIMLLVVGRNDMIARFLMNKFKRYVRVPRKSSMAYVAQVSSKCYE